MVAFILALVLGFGPFFQSILDSLLGAFSGTGAV